MPIDSAMYVLMSQSLSLWCQESIVSLRIYIYSFEFCNLVFVSRHTISHFLSGISALYLLQLENGTASTYRLLGSITAWCLKLTASLYGYLKPTIAL